MTNLKYFCAAFVSLSLTACGSGNAGEGSADNGKLTIKFVAAETESSGGGLINACKIQVKAHNRLGHEAKYVGLTFTPMVDDEIEAMAAKASGDQKLYIGKVQKGETVDDDSKARGVRCESITSLKVLTVECGKPDGGGSCAENVVIDGNGILEIQR